MNSSSRVRKGPSFTKRCIMDALLQLMHTKDYDDITITDITEKAGVSRMSYYRNYHSKDEILMDYMFRIIKEYALSLANDFPELQNGFQTYDHILHGLRYLQKYADYALCLKKSNRSEIILHGLDFYMLTIAGMADSDSPRKYELYYYSGALYNIFLHWIEDGMKEDIEVIASLIYRHIQKNPFLSSANQDSSGRPSDQPK